MNSGSDNDKPPNYWVVDESEVVVKDKEVRSQKPDVHYQLTIPYLSSKGSWWRGTAVERRSLAGELSLSCARPAADG